MRLVGATPTDLRPSPATPSQPHHTTKSYKCFYLRQRVGALQSLGVTRKKIHGELLRIPLLRTRVNNGVRAGVVRLGCSMDIGQPPSTLASMPPPSGHWAPPSKASA